MQATKKDDDIWFDVSAEDLVNTLGADAVPADVAKRVAGAASGGVGGLAVAAAPTSDPRRIQRVLQRGTFEGPTKHVAMDCEMVRQYHSLLSLTPFTHHSLLRLICYNLDCEIVRQ
jgi:hypothetical protein